MNKNNHDQDHTPLAQAKKIAFDKYPTGPGARTWMNLMRWAREAEDEVNLVGDTEAVANIAELRISNIPNILKEFPGIVAAAQEPGVNNDKICLQEWQKHPQRTEMQLRASTATKMGEKKDKSVFKYWDVDGEALVRLIKKAKDAGKKGTADGG
ncbi:hypothetical protein K490DRAFT_63887 [Saccharata proteae CBS 121410]|uniref:Uncharacterized protein n=1 Tax=Saccharata proteae CBS 121410 TaxID=1314787 RepID=A0A6A5YDZ3_9PEZI|nr:hypothetical protein K490DRAFT_63887 [Saccharata proteae CBS 121410]